MNDEFMLEEEYPTRFDESCRIMEARYINNEPYCRHREEMGKRLCVVFCWVVFSLCSLSGWCSLSSLASSSFFFFFFLSSLVPSLGPAGLIMSFFKGGFKPHKLLWIYHAKHFRD